VIKLKAIDSPYDIAREKKILTEDLKEGGASYVMSFIDDFAEPRTRERGICLEYSEV
jgi:hypothetical protein